MRRGTICLLALACVIVTGCGKKIVQPKGQVYKDGKPWKLSDKGMFIIQLHSESDSKMGAQNVEVKPDGSFTVMGKDRKGVPAGKYKVSIEAKDPYSADAKDLLEGKYSGTNSKLVVEVGKDDLKIEIPDK